VVFCNSNKNELTADGYYLSIYDQKFTINAWWGLEEFIRSRFNDKISNKPLILNIPYKHFHGSPEDNVSNKQKETDS
jgi:hypothetical protein